MGKLVALDYGSKRTGIAETDSLQMIASGLETVETKNLQSYMVDYLNRGNVDGIVIGEPKDLKNQSSAIETQIGPFINFLKKRFPSIPIHRVDERFTSKIAFQAMIDGGLGKKKRQNKATIDQVSATLILQSFLEAREAR